MEWNHEIPLIFEIKNYISILNITEKKCKTTKSTCTINNGLFSYLPCSIDLALIDFLLDATLKTQSMTIE